MVVTENHGGDTSTIKLSYKDCRFDEHQNENKAKSMKIHLNNAILCDQSCQEALRSV